MRLRQLQARFVKIIDERTEQWEGVSFEEADGIHFLCPRCFETNGGEVGTHSIICYRPRVSLDRSPGPGRWEFRGTSLDDLWLVASSSSVSLQGGCNAHFMVENGETRFV